MVDKLMPRDVKTRWNSTFAMLDFAIRYRRLLDQLSGERANGLRDLELKENEWKIVEQLRDVLKVRTFAQRGLLFAPPQLSRAQIFQDATAFFSWGTPNLATVVPAMDHIDHVLASQAVNHTFAAPICVALAMGKKTLNRYYNLTDSSEVYRIAMGQFPFTTLCMMYY
jgi:hypothetical protein